MGFFPLFVWVFFFPFFGVKAHYSLYNKVRRSGQDLQFQTLELSTVIFYNSMCLDGSITLF